MKELIYQQTALQLDNSVFQCSSSSTTRHTKRSRHLDRFIPSRSAKPKFNDHIFAGPTNTNNSYNRIIAENLMNGGQCERMLSFREETQSTRSTQQCIYDLIVRRTQSDAEHPTRNISPVPEKILDAPELRDDYYLNLLDWSNLGPLAIGLNQRVYLYTPRQISELCSLDDAYVCSVAFHAHNPLVAVGTSTGRIHLYDIQKECLLRVMRGHYSRVSSLSFNSVLFSGSKDTTILGHDIKSPNNVMSRFDGHKAEVCGLKHDASGLASGSNDNTAVIWDINAGKQRFTLNGHKAAVKALAWCPWQKGLLATGGGTTDKTMKFWNTDTGKLINSVNTQSQVCSLIWNRNDKEIMSSHGFSHNQLCIWKVNNYVMQYPQATKVVELQGHTQRVLYMALSPDGSTVCSASADETLRFWRVFDSQTNANYFGKDVNHLYPGNCSLR